MIERHSSLLPFLIELRKRLFYCIIVLFFIFAGLFFFANDLYSLLASPLLKHLPKGQGLIATNIIAPFWVPFELTWAFSIFLAVPFCLYQLWAFIAPALYRHEKKFVWVLMFMSTILFYLGIAFAYFIIFPILFSFLTRTAPVGVLVSPDISEYLNLTLKLFLVFGCIFEVPVLTILLIKSGITTRERLIEIRPYAIVGAFILGMLFAPPDVVSQTLLAVPLWLLFEMGIYLAKFFKPMG